MNLPAPEVASFATDTAVSYIFSSPFVSCMLAHGRTHTGCSNTPSMHVLSTHTHTHTIHRSFRETQNAKKSGWSTHFTALPKTVPWPYQFQFGGRERDVQHVEGLTQPSFSVEYIEAMSGIDETPSRRYAAAAGDDGGAAAATEEVLVVVEEEGAAVEDASSDGVSEQEKIELLIREMAIRNIESRKSMSGGVGGGGGAGLEEDTAVGVEAGTGTGTLG